MVSNGQNSQNIHSGAGGIAGGQKTAYGYVGGINGQGLNTMISHSNFNGVNNLNNKNRNLSSKSTTGNNTLINS